jgi:hypothetical protein
MEDFDLDLDELEPMYGEAYTESDSGSACGNCGKVTAELHNVPEFDYIGCTECLEEAVALLEAEAAGKELYPAERQILAAARRKPMGNAFAVKEVA